MPEKYSQEAELVYGIQPVLELLASDRDTDRIFIQRDTRNEQLMRIQQQARERGVPVVRVPAPKLSSFTRKNHQGVVAMVAAVRFASLDYIISDAFSRGKMPFLLLLDQVTDVRNFGAIARAAECAGADALVVPFKGAARMGGDAVRTSSGALNHLPVCREPDLVKTVKNLKASGLATVACTEKATYTVFNTDLNGPLAIIMGAEDQGISPEILRLADHHCKIPMQGRVGSLNVSVATGIVLFEAVRQRVQEEA